MKLFRNKIETVNSILISVMLACNSVAILLDFIPKSAVFSIYVPFLLIIGLNIRCLIRQNYTYHFIFVVYVLLFFLIPLFLGNTESQLIHYFLDFFVFGIPFLLLPFVPVDYKAVFKSLSILGLLLFPSLLKIDLIEQSDGGLWMTISYNVIKFIVPALIVIFFRSSKLFKVIGIVVSLGYLAFLLTWGSRGAMLSIIVALWLLYIYRKNKPLRLFSKKVLLNVCFVFFIAAVFPYIIRNVVDFLNAHHIYSYSLSRIEEHLESNTSQSEGRTYIYEMAKTGILEKPILGNGIASFANYSPDTYPHNLFLQQLYEGGVFLFIPFFILTCMGIFFINGRGIPIEKRQFLIYLVSVGIIHLMFSSYFWMNHFYWYLLGFSLQKNRLK